MNDYTIDDVFNASSPYFNNSVEMSLPPSAENGFTNAIDASKIMANELNPGLISFINDFGAISARVVPHTSGEQSGLSIQVRDGLGGTESELSNEFYYIRDTGKGTVVWNITDGGQMTFGNFSGTQNVWSLTNAQLLNDLDPYADNTVDLGNSGALYSDIWCTTINRTAESSPSDIRLKKNITPLAWGLAELEQLNPVRFEWKKDNRPGYGFIAQDLQGILPDLVSPMVERVEIKHPKNAVPADVDMKTVRPDVLDKDVVVERKTVPVVPETLQIEYSALVPLLVRAVQQLTARVKELEKV